MKKRYSYTWCVVCITGSNFPVSTTSFIKFSRFIIKMGPATLIVTRMWANAQRDGRPGAALCSTPQSLADVHYWSAMQYNAAKTRNPLKLAGVPKLPDRSQPLVGRSSPYCGDIWRRYWCLKSFFLIADMCLSREDIARQSCAMASRWRIFRRFWRPVFSASRV